MAYLLDGIVIIVFVVTCVVGYTRGFVKYIIAMLRTVITVVLAMVLAFALAQPVYDNMLKEKTTQKIEQALEKADVVSIVQKELTDEGLEGYFSEGEIQQLLENGGDIAGSLEGLLLDKGATQDKADEIKDRFDKFVDNEMLDKVINEVYNSAGESIDSEDTPKLELDSREVGNFISAIADSDKSAGADYIEKNYAQPVIISVLKAVLFVIMYLIVFVMLTIILHISGVFNKVPLVSAANRFAGLALGVVKGALYIALLAFIMCMIVNGTKNQLVQMNSGIVEKTYLFRYFFDFFYK